MVHSCVSIFTFVYIIFASRHQSFRKYCPLTPYSIIKHGRGACLSHKKMSIACLITSSSLFLPFVSMSCGVSTPGRTWALFPSGILSKRPTLQLCLKQATETIHQKCTALWHAQKWHNVVLALSLGPPLPLEPKKTSRQDTMMRWKSQGTSKKKQIKKKTLT